MTDYDYLLCGGAVLLLDRRASVQFTAAPTVFRVIRVVPERTNDDGWIWLDGYTLDASGDAIERRRVYVRVGGWRLVDLGQQARRRTNPRDAQSPAGARSSNPTPS